jgi:hypothetical protein
LGAGSAAAGLPLGVWAAEIISNALENFDLSESRWCHFFGMGKGSSTPENAENFSIKFLPPRLLAWRRTRQIDIAPKGNFLNKYIPSWARAGGERPLAEKREVSFRR